MDKTVVLQGKSAMTWMHFYDKEHDDNQSGWNMWLNMTNQWIGDSDVHKWREIVSKNWYTSATHQDAAI